MRPSVQQPISKDKNVIARARKYYLKQLFDLEVKVPRRSLRYATHHLMVMHPHTKYHWPISKDKNVMAQTRKYYLQNNYLTLRSTVKVPRRSLRYTHTALWSFTHIPNIIDLSGKTKKLWSGQASLRSGRKNQTKTMSPFVRIILIWNILITWLNVSVTVLYQACF
jgi:hypothetical protein